jgi:hypothetical protein
MDPFSPLETHFVAVLTSRSRKGSRMMLAWLEGVSQVASRNVTLRNENLIT